MVPVTLNTPNPEGAMYFTKVQHGQSLWSVATEYGTIYQEYPCPNNLGRRSNRHIQGRNCNDRCDSIGLPTVEATLTLPVTETLMPTAAVVETIGPNSTHQTIAPIEEEKHLRNRLLPACWLWILIVAAL